MKALMWITVVAILESYVLTKAYALTCPNVNVTSETEVICEGQESTISCAHTPGTVLNIVFANYGRRGDDLCLHTHMRNKYCLTTNSTAIVKNRCESKVSCLLQANNVAFGGDPCGGTYKYLELRFQCKVSVNSTSGFEPSFPTTLSYNYQLEVEANIVDKRQTVQAQIYYSYYKNMAAISVKKEGREAKYIYNYEHDEIYKTTAFGCTVEQLSTSNDTYSTWLLGYTYFGKELHVAYPRWQTELPYDVEYGELYLGNTTVRGLSVDHWQICGNWEQNSTMLIDYYFSRDWDTASSFRTVPVRTEVRADELYPNGTVYNLHHIYDFYNYNYYVDNDATIFETPVDVVCPGRKDTKPVLMIPDSFYYRVEVIDSARSMATYEDVWYAGQLRYYRRDYRPLYKHYPTFNTNPISEIHDYDIGVRYVVDKIQGNCTILPLTNTSGDATMNFTSQHKVDSYILNLKNPLQLFNLDVNYTYIGQFMERGVLCDVFVAIRPNLYITGFLDLNVNTTVTYWFLAKYWTNYVNVRPFDSFQTPVKMELNAKEFGFKAIYNYVDFSPDTPLLEVFDIAPCFSDDSKLKFQVQFPGTYKKTESIVLKELAHKEFARHLNVSILRIQDVNLLYDDFNLYISATLLDRPPAPALFEYIPGKVLEKIEDSDVYHVSLPMQCADFCVNNQGFICNSFDFCSNDQTCRLSKQHLGNGTSVLTSSKSCDHFSRSVQGSIPTLSVQDAYKNFRQKVFEQAVTLSLSVSGNDYTAVDVSVVFGWMTSNVEMPKLNDYFQYKLEIIIPYKKYAYEGQVWYDRTLGLIREDVHFDTMNAPLHPITIVSDFTTGLQYTVDRVSKNCTLVPIHSNSFGAIQNYSLPYQENSTWSLRMKSPQEIFYIDDTYDFVGQKTVRGMLCNVFESLRLDYNVLNSAADKASQSVFRYFFLADGWYEVSEEKGGSRSQPVKLEITVLEFDTFIEYMFYDFNDDRPDLTTYDIHECFETGDKYTFQIAFPGPYHPYLDTQSNTFQTEAVFAMSRLTLLPPLKFQRTSLYHDNNNIYVTTTMVGETRILSYYTYVQQGSIPAHPEGVYDEIQNLDACLQLCYTSTSFVCNSFYYCPNEMQCLFSKQHVPNIPAPATTHACQAYSRTVDVGTFAPPSINAAIRMLKNNIYRGNVQILIPGPGPQGLHEYTATSIRTDIIGTSQQEYQATALSRFTIFKNNSGSIDIDSEMDDLSVDECAKVCLNTKAFQCHGFYYCDTTFICGLVKTRPDRLPAPSTDMTASCYIYQRDYIDDYTKNPGTIMATSADFSFYPVVSSNDCAKQCSQDDTLHCRAFQFCDSTKECFLFRSRTVGMPKPRGVTSCSFFTRNYLVGFQTVTNGSFIFSSVVEFSSVTPSQCAQVCVEQLGTSCDGFYFCRQSTACYLTSKVSQSENVPGEPTVVVDTSSQASFCNYYKIIEQLQTSTSTSTSTSSATTKTTRTTIPATPQVPITCPTLPSSTNTPSTSTSTSTTTTTPTATTTPTTTTTTTTPSTTTMRMAPPTCSCPQKTVLVPITWTPGTTSGNQPTALQQTAGLNTKSKNTNTGLVVGVAIATFVLGLVGGGAIVFLFQKRYPNKTKRGDDECEMNFTRLEENHIQDSTS